MKRIKHLELLFVISALLGGCTVHASMKAGSTFSSGAESTTESSRASSSRQASKAHSEPSREVAVREQGLATHDNAEERRPASPPPSGGTGNPSVNNSQTEHAKPSAKPTTVAAADHDRGHGNDADGGDEDNPGKSRRSTPSSAHAGNQKPAKLASKKSDADHDRGHGNDADGVDEDNPGKSKKPAPGK